MAADSAATVDFTVRGTMVEALLTTRVGAGRETTPVAAETLGMMQLLQGTLITTENMDRMSVFKEKVLAALVRQLMGTKMEEHVQSLQGVAYGDERAGLTLRRHAPAAGLATRGNA